MPLIPPLGGQRQADLFEFQASAKKNILAVICDNHNILNYSLRSYLFISILKQYLVR